MIRLGTEVRRNCLGTAVSLEVRGEISDAEVSEYNKEGGT